MTIKENGKLLKKLTVESGVSKAGNAWQTQTIVVGFPIPINVNELRPVALKALTKTVRDIEELNEGDKVECVYIIEAREYAGSNAALKGKWFNDVTLLSIRKAGPVQLHPETPKPAPAPEAESLNNAEHPEDLPF